MTERIAIRAENLGKCYRMFPSPRARLAQGIWGQRRKLYEEKWALRGVSFELPAGQTLGVVGRNGSGKSTLLQLLCGTLTATEGHVNCRGRLAALLELGSGFNPEFSGLENVFLNATLLGLNQKEVEDRLDAILAFADIGDYIYQPVKTYSSGMSVRLAFAVQANIDPEILIVDEALAVGDELFQKKCYARLSKLKARGTSILLVTHSCPQIIQHCDQALLLHKGQLQLLGKPSLVTTTYQQLANAPDEEWAAVIERKRKTAEASTSSQAPEDALWRTGTAASNLIEESLVPKSKEIYKSKGVEIHQIRIENPDGTPTNQIPFRAAFQIRFGYRSSQDFTDQAIRFGCHIASTQGIRVTGQAFPSKDDSFTTRAGEEWEIVYSFGPGLYPGVYFVGGGVVPAGNPGFFIHRVIDFIAFRVLLNSESNAIGQCDLSSAPPELIKRPEPPAPAGT